MKEGNEKDARAISERQRGDLEALSLSLASLPSSAGRIDQNLCLLPGASEAVYVVVVHAYTATEQDELSVTHGQRLRLLQVTHTQALFVLHDPLQFSQM